MGRVGWASEVFNCNAPGHRQHGAAAPVRHARRRSERWLQPLLEGEIRSAFAMTEPDVASSDATNIQTSIVRDGDDYVINGRKWFITGAAHPNCRLLIVMGKTEPGRRAPPPAEHGAGAAATRPASTIVRNINVMNHLSPEGHCEIVFRDVRVPVANLLGEEGSGFALAQARLGPGRIHHCMRSIGAARARARADGRARAGAQGLRPVPAPARHRRRLDRAARASRSSRRGCWC